MNRNVRGGGRTKLRPIEAKLAQCVFRAALGYLRPRRDEARERRGLLGVVPVLWAEVSNAPNEAFKATASAASPLTRSSQRNSFPLRFPFSVSFKPSGDIATT
jgi:hypothetical protein